MKVIALAPLAAVRSTSATDAATSQNGTMTMGMNRSGAAALHSSRMKSFQATHARRRELLVLRREQRAAGEPGEGREAHLRVDPVEVHVGQTSGHVVATGEHLVEADRVDAEVLGVLSRHGVQPDGGNDPVLEAPRLLATVELDDVRSGLAVLGREAVEPHPLVLDHMVVDRDQLDVVAQHAGAPRDSDPPNGRIVTF